MIQATNNPPQIVLSASGASVQSKRRGKQSTSKALIPSSSLNGINAAPAFDGQNGQRVKLELVPSSEGGFNAKGLIGKITSMTHIDAGFDLFVDARGSDGEDGGTGGNGLPGERGSDGEDATQHEDAVRGGNGGRGGDGGLGSSGGNGGSGGTVKILTSEVNMHLIFALNWNVRGGKGGKAGKHGFPGRGGLGGRGGNGYKWRQEHIGYECRCAPHGTRSVSAPLMHTGQGRQVSNLAALSQLQAGQDLSFAFPQGYISDGSNIAPVSNLQGKIPASIAPQFQRALLGSASEGDSSNAITQRGYSATTSGHMPGCEQVPTYTTCHRPGASDGKDGASGRTPATSLNVGQDGMDGTGSILVRNDEGSISTYHSKFEFQLLGFDVVDENNDGVFEPHECVIVKNIRIKNSGGMPTPKKTLIPVRLQASAWLTPVPGKDTIFLPLDIPPGSTKSISNEIWARINSPSTQPNSTAFKEISAVKLQAVVPDLDRKIPQFDFSQNISIQYPVKFVTDEFKWMDTISQGSSTSLQWAVMNISSKDIGIHSRSQRMVVTQISCPRTAPVILGDTLSKGSQSDENCRRQEIHLLRRDMSSPVSEGLLVPKNTAEYSTVDFLIELLLTPWPVGQSRNSADLITLQTYRLNMQVSKTWQYNSSSEFLLLTSKSTSKDTIISWSQFIQKHLYKSVDVWNVSLYGGFETEATQKSVLDSYVGKTILALDDDLFSYFDRGQRSILDFMDPVEGSGLARNGTRVVSVHRKAKERNEREERNIELVAHAAALKGSNSTENELQRFGSTTELIARLHELRESPSVSTQSQQYYVPFTGSYMHKKGREIAKKLTKEFPLDLFLVTDSSDGLGVKIVHCGAHGQSYSTAQVAQSSNGVGRVEEFSGLNPAEAYACVAALPMKTRLDILLTSQQATETVHYSQFIQKAALSSVKAQLHDQVQAMAKHPRWRDGLFPDTDKVSTMSLFESTNDSITAVLNHDIMLNAGASIDDSSSPAGQILRSIIQSARCQTTEQLLIRWFSPFKRTRSHVRRSLMGTVQNVIVSNGPNHEPNQNAPQASIKTFKESVNQKVFNKNYQRGINNGVQAITHNAIRDLKQSLASIEEVMPRSVYKSPPELSAKKVSYEKAELRRNQDRMQHRSWKKELGLDMTGAGSVKTDNAAIPEEASSLYSSELVSTSAYGRGMSSSRSATSTILTLPEMESSTTSVKKSPNVPQLENNHSRSLSPGSPLSPEWVTSSAELGSTRAHHRSVVSDHNKTSTALPLSRDNEKSRSWIAGLRELPQVNVENAPSPQPLSPQSVPELPPNSDLAHNRTPMSHSGNILPAFSPPEIDNISPPLSPAELHRTNSWAEEQTQKKPRPQIHKSASPPLSPSLISTPIPHVPTHIPPIPATASHMSRQSEDPPLGRDETTIETVWNEKMDEIDDAESSHVSAASGRDGAYIVQATDDEDVDMPVWDEYDDEDLRIDWTGDSGNGAVTGEY